MPASSSAPAPDRYVSFCGLDCDTRATALLERVRFAMTGAAAGSPWAGYFDRKFTEKARMGHDDLYFVGSQMNSLRSFVEELEDEEALVELDRLEHRCC